MLKITLRMFNLLKLPKILFNNMGIWSQTNQTLAVSFQAVVYHQFTLKGAIFQRFFYQLYRFEHLQHNHGIHNTTNFDFIPQTSPQKPNQNYLHLQLNGIINFINRKIKKSMEPETQLQSSTIQIEQVGLKQLFRYADKTDYILIAIGSAFSILLGTAIPVFAYMMGSMIDAFTDPNTIYEQSKTIFYVYISLGCAALVIAWVMFTTWTVMGERQGIKCRRQYFKSLIRQQIAWFDMNKQSQISSTFSANALTFQQAVGQKLSTLITLTSMFCSGLGISFYLGWELTLIILGYLPIIIICWSNNIKTKTQVASKQEKIYLKSDAKAQESLIAIKLVKQMNGQDFQSKNNQEMLKEVGQNYLQASKKYIIAASFAILSLYLGFALTFWFGSQCIFNSQKCPQRLNPTKYTAGNVIKIFYSLIMPAVSLNQLTPSILKIREGKVAAAKLFSIIDKVPLIRSKENAIIPQTFKGVIKFQNVSFAYPTQKNVKILQNLNVQIDCKSSAIIGASGCGKSTTLQLIMRFYDPDEGTVYLDGIDLRQINVQWLRSQIGYVGQEPVLFATTIRQNMQLCKQHATQQQIYEALKKAQAYDFVMELKDKLDTFVGGGGNQLSGGQKQRIALARALLKHPKILLLDEATSALDRKNEKQILTTLHSVGKEQITISITHRQKVLDGCQKVLNFKNKKIQKITVNQMNQIKLLEKQTRVLENQNNQNNANNLQIPNLIKGYNKKSMNTATKNTLIQGLDSAIALINNQQEQKKQKTTNNHTLTRLFQFLFEKKCLFIFGFIVSVIQGLVFPAIGVFTAKIVASQLKYIYNNQFYSGEIRKYIYITLGTAFFGALNNPIMHFTFTVLGSNSVKTIRTKAYQKILRMPIEWFQKAENQPEIVISRLCSGCKTLYNFVELYMPHCTTLFSNVIFSLIGAIIFQWRTGLTSVALIPLIILSQAIQFAYIRGLTQSKGKIFEQSSQIINENVMNIRTILSFGNPYSIQNRYNMKLNEIIQILMKKYLFSGFMYGISYFLQYLCFALMFFLSAIYGTNYNVDISDSLSSMFLIIFAAISAGNQTNFMQDISNAKIAAKNLFQFLDLQDEHQIRQKLNSQKLRIQIRGNITFRNVCLKYNNRQVYALNNVSFTVKEGQKVGIVGQSGCGKSTILNLLLGFYYANSGEIFLENININDYDLSYLREVFGVVSQEPVLFDQSIRWNIKYNKTEVSEQQIIEASHEVNFNPYTENHVSNLNILNFQTAQDQNNNQIQEGYSKCVGPRGSHVSGGQKQRIAIARTILRKPKILLLDQATSALDPQNEAKVQKSLDTIMKGRTTINITHRLQTIENADQIIVINRGVIQKIGTYNYLSTHNEHFCTLLRGSLIHD